MATQKVPAESLRVLPVDGSPPWTVSETTFGGVVGVQVEIFTHASAIAEYHCLTNTAVKQWTRFNFPEKKAKTSQPLPMPKSLYKQEGCKQEGKK